MKWPKYHIGDFTFIDKTDMTTAQWVAFRQYGVGGSDVTSILDLNPYASITQLFFEKIGYRDPVDLTDNLFVYWGDQFEPNITSSARYYNLDSSDPLNFLQYYYAGRVQNNILPFKFIVKHKRWPFFLLNLDAVEPEDPEMTEEELHQSIVDGVIPPLKRVHEMKTMSSYVSDTWENGLPVGYIGQVHSYAMPFLEIFPKLETVIWSLQDGRELEPHPITPSPVLCDQIAMRSEAFWESVQEGKVLLSKGLDMGELDRRLSEMAPVPDNITPAYNEFLSKVLQEKKEHTIAGLDDQREMGLKFNVLSRLKKEVDSMATVYAASIKEFMHQNDARILQYGEKERISFNKRLFTKTLNSADREDACWSEVKQILKSYNIK